ncbi:MAG: low specificity L-threonine aldolase [Tyzzerella sp.]|nr:low specificity L-threonine aldolase [Tyzzerella sp.]
MIRFNCDYLEGAHPRIMQALMDTNMVQTVGYGEDEYCEEAREKIKEACKCEEAEVHFLVGGTQANMTVIASILRPHQAVLCVKEGHINVHETGAIEATGHKVMAIGGKDGKLTAEQIREAHKNHWEDGAHEHITQPKLVYISNPTELGTIYSKAELEEIRKACDDCNMYLFLDGARLGYGLMSEESDFTLEDVAKNCDVFYIGGTKVGALFGEAVVITNKALQEDFRYIIKQKGGMLAKGRLLGIQFLELFKDGLYFEISAHAMRLAKLLKEGLIKAGYKFYADSPTNQLFVIVSDDKLKQLDEKYSYEYQMRYDETSSVIRFCTSWATKEENVLALLEDMK